MRKLLVPVLLVASLGATSAALAVTNNTTKGTISAIDLKGETVTIGKSVFHFPAKFDLSSFKVGEKVDVTWHAYKKIDVATKIVADTTPAKPAKPVAPKPTTKTTTPAKSS